MMDREVFLKASPPEEHVDLPGTGTVRVRGLTREEVHALAPLKKDQGTLERRIIHMGLISPSLSEEDVVVWYGSAPAGHTDLIVGAVSRLSGLFADSSKSGVPAVRGKRRA